MTHPDLEIRPYRPGDEEQILKTFNLVFREVCGPGFVDRTMEQWRWQYQQNPVGQRMSLAVAQDGTVVSQYAGVPLLADTSYGPQVFVHCVDSMTHPAWRQGLKRPGVFVITGLPFSAHSRKIADAVLYGFPVDAAFRIGQRYLEYHFLRTLDYLVRETKQGVAPCPAGIEVERVDAIPADVDALWERARANKACALRRDHRYLDWRYVQIPSRKDYEVWTARRNGTLVGLMVLQPRHELIPSACTIADWVVETADEAVLDAFVHVATQRATDLGRDKVFAFFAPTAPEWQLFTARGFAVLPSSIWMERRLVYLITGSPMDEGYLANQWWYTLGDSDLV